MSHLQDILLTILVAGEQSKEQLLAALNGSHSERSMYYALRGLVAAGLVEHRDVKGKRYWRAYGQP